MVLLGEKVTHSAPDYITMLGAGVVKYAEERLLAATPVGNGTLVSGAIKLGIGFGAHHMFGGNKMGDMVSLGFTVDGVEDILQGVIGGGIFGGANANANAW
jgi:hypothetical protein